MTFEPVQAGAPHFPVRLKPLVELDQRFKAKAVEALLAVGADGNQTGIAQHAKLLRNRRLCHGEPSDQGVHGLLSVEQLVEDLPAAPLRDDFEGFPGDHPSSMPQRVYVCQGIYLLLPHDGGSAALCPSTYPGRFSGTPPTGPSSAKQVDGLGCLR